MGFPLIIMSFGAKFMVSLIGFLLACVCRYNHLKEAVEDVQGQIDRLRDPLLLNLPTPPPKRLEQS